MSEFASAHEMEEEEVGEEANLQKYNDPIHIFLKGKKLDGASKPFFAILYKVTPGNNLEEISHSEIVDSSAPVWTSVFEHVYLFGINQPMLVRVYSSTDGKSIDSEHSAYVGEETFRIAELITNYAITLKLKNKDNREVFEVSVSGELGVENKDVITFEDIRGTLVKPAFNMNLITPSTYVLIERLNEMPVNSMTAVLRTKIVDHTYEPVYPSISIRKAALCNCDDERILRVSVYKSKHTLIGSFRTNARVLLENDGNETFVLLDADEKEVGSLRIKCSVNDQPTLPAFIQTGYQIAMTVAVDCTSSNGLPNNPKSRHFIRPDRTTKNPYETVIETIGEVLETYDTDKKFPLFGFGGKPTKPNGRPEIAVNHAFPMTPETAPAEGVSGLVEAYRKSIPTVTLSGPTYLSEIICKAASLSRVADQHQPTYTVLVIITDGVVNDMEATKAAIIDASNDSPLSIVIIGVGSDNFHDMHFLDSDKHLLEYHDRDGRVRKAKRDIVQFVHFDEAIEAGKDAFSHDVLTEIPQQILGYLDSKNETVQSIKERVEATRA